MNMMRLKDIFKKEHIPIALALLLSAGYILASTNIPQFETLKANAADILIQQRCRFSSPPEEIKDITIVTIDEESLRRLRQRWPVSRGIYAALIDRLSRDGSKPLATGMDLFFSGASERPEDDMLLAESMKRSGNSVIASYVSESGTIIKPEEALAQAAAGIGFVSAPRDGDMVVRETYPVVPLTDSGFIYSFPLALYGKSRGIYLDKAYYRASDSNILIPGLESGEGARKIPVDPIRRTMRINYFAPMGGFKTIPLWKALSSSGLDGFFKDKIVLIGTIIEIHHDVYPTPLGIMPGVAINANIVLDLMSQRQLVWLPFWIMCPILLAAAVIVGAVTYRLGMLKGAAIGTCLLAAGFILASLCVRSDRIFDLFGFAFTSISSFTGVSIWMSLSTLIENARLSGLVMTDALTGMFTYRYFELILQREAASALDKGAEMSLAIFDIDDFKKINDTYGHKAGNDVLRGAAAAIKDHVPAPGVVARFGGDEFVVVLPGIHSGEALAIASRAIEAARTLAFAWLPKGRAITMSAGLVTTGCSPDMAGKDLVKAADAELYKAKASGKNRVSAA